MINGCIITMWKYFKMKHKKLRTIKADIFMWTMENSFSTRHKPQKLQRKRLIDFITWTFNIYMLKINTHAFLVAQLVKNPPAIWETWVWSLGWEDPLEKGKASHSSILAWRIPWTIQSMGSKRVGHDWELSLFTFKVTQMISCQSEIQIRALDFRPSTLSLL